MIYFAHCSDTNCLANLIIALRVRGITRCLCTQTQTSQGSGRFLTIVLRVIFDIIISAVCSHSSANN